ncbi:MAG: hypothetical protein WC549_03360 [Actinomycetota bacterium]
MNKFNRVIMVIILLIIFLVSITAVVNKFMDLFEWSDILNKAVGWLGGLNIYIAGAIMLVVIVVSLVLLILEFSKKE